MCDKNCGSGGTDICTCHCQPVMAFKSKNGELYLSAQECQRHDIIYDNNLRLRKIEQEFYKIYQGKNNDWVHVPSDAVRFIQIFACRWKEIKEVLNGIKD